MTDPTRGVSQVPDGAREALAAAICPAATVHAPCTRRADELLTALSAAGYVVVKAEQPAEPSRRMTGDERVRAATRAALPEVNTDRWPIDACQSWLRDVLCGPDVELCGSP